MTGTSPLPHPMELAKCFAAFYLVLLASCHHVPGPVDTARLRITQHQTRCCYFEGQVSFLEVADTAGNVLVHEEFEALDMIQPVVDSAFPPGLYTVRSWQRPCNGDCSRLDALANACEAKFQLKPGADVFVTAAFEPRDACSIQATPEPLLSAVPDAVVFRPKYTNCGEDFRAMPAAFPDSRAELNRVRDCFAQANRNGVAAEMMGVERAPAEDNAVYRVIYITHPDRGIEVFRRTTVSFAVSYWERYVCDSLGVDEVRNFSFGGCSAPVAM